MQANSFNITATGTAPVSPRDYHRIILAGLDDRNIPLYFSYPEHGGPRSKEEILFCHMERYISAHLRQVYLDAVKHYPHIAWEFKKFDYTVKNFNSIAWLKDEIDGCIRKQALDKLTDEEKRVLGVGSSSYVGVSD